MICKVCGIENKYLINGECKKCYQNKYSKFFYKDSKNKNLKELHKQRNVITSVEKICSVCGKKYFTQGRKNSGKTCSLKCRKKHYQEYYKQPRIKARMKAYHLSHLKERQVYLKRKEQENPVHKLAHLLRSNLKRNLLLKFNDKDNTRFEELVGYSYSVLKKHLEAQFTSEMSWDNYGTFWQVDHIVPLSWFKTKEQFLEKGWALSNLQPLESVLNLSKQDKFVGNSRSKFGVLCV